MELQLWREMLTPYELAVDELVLKFRHIIREYRKNRKDREKSKKMTIA